MFAGLSPCSPPECVLNQLSPRTGRSGFAQLAGLCTPAGPRATLQPPPLHPAPSPQVARLGELLANVVSDTRGRIEKKQAQTYEEMLAELEEAEAEAAAGADEDEEEDEYIYNPLKLPLGWDGKPIPYWLYKLHGLNQEFRCEICGNYRWARCWSRVLGLGFEV